MNHIRPDTTVPEPRHRWRDKAACLGKGAEKWFTRQEGARSKEAREACEGCPVRRDCGLHAIRCKIRYGIWAGYRMSSPTARRELREWLGLPPQRHDCSEDGAA